jgi:YtkA-like
MPESNLEEVTAEPPGRSLPVAPLAGRKSSGEGAGRRAARRLIAIVICAAAGVAAVVLTGVGRGPTPVSLRADTADYHVRLDLDSASLGRRTATVQVAGADGRPVTAAEVDVRMAMTAMRMTGEPLRAGPTAPGRYEVNDDLFTMLGDWTVTVRISMPGSTSTQEAVFTVKAVP